MSVSRNLIAGLSNSAWSALLALAMVPFYLKYLGVESYGLIGFFLTTQALFQLLDMGIAPTINREVARSSAAGDLSAAGNLLHSLAVVYWIIALFIAMVMLFLASFIAESWLQSKTLPVSTVAQSVILIGVVVACRWPIGLYQGALVGAQRLAVASVINMGMITLASIGSLVIILFLSPTIQAFFIWQACVGLAHATAVRFFAWRIIGRRADVQFDFSLIKKIWRFTAGMSAITLMGIIFTQLDKVLLSRLIALEDFSHYMLASMVASSLYLIVGPVYSVVYSRFSAIVVNGTALEIMECLRLYTRSLAVCLLPVVMMLAVFSKELVEVWTGSGALGTTVGPIVSLLAIGAALNGIMTVPHALQLALGMTRVPLMINGFLMVVIAPLIISLSLAYGALGGALAWLIFNVLYVFLSAWLMHRRVLENGAGEWLVKDIILPIFIFIAVGLVTKTVFQEFQLSTILTLVLVSLQVIAMCLLGVFLTPGLNSVVKNTIFGDRERVEKA